MTPLIDTPIAKTRWLTTKSSQLHANMAQAFADLAIALSSLIVEPKIHDGSEGTIG